MKNIILLAVLGMCLFNVKAQNTLTLDWGTASNYLAHGRTLSDDLTCFQPGIYYKLQKGPTISAWFSLPYDRNASIYDEWNIIVDHSINIFKHQKNWNINFHGYANYWFLPQSEEAAQHIQDYYQGMKYNAGVHFPFVLSSEHKIGFTTGYDYFYYHQVGRDMGINAAGIHEFLIKFNKSFKKFNLTCKSVLSNNRGAVNAGIDKGWAYFLQHLSCSFNIKQISLQPSANYQRTFTSTIHKKDNFLWFGLNVKRTFKL